MREELAVWPNPSELEGEEITHRKLEDRRCLLSRLVDKHVPWTSITVMTRRWWTDELKRMRKIKQNLAHKSSKKLSMPTHPVHEAYRKIRNEYTDLV
jgi:hypothetical protein